VGYANARLYKFLSEIGANAMKRTQSSMCLIVILGMSLAACGAASEKKSAPDAAIGGGVDARPATVDAAPQPTGTDPLMTEVPCGPDVAVTVEYYSCAFFIGGGDVKLGQTVQFTGCQGHEVKSGGGKNLTPGDLPVCYKMTSVGKLDYGCVQHPNNKGQVNVTP
jgi:hypothetical protein